MLLTSVGAAFCVALAGYNVIQNHPERKLRRIVSATFRTYKMYTEFGPTKVGYVKILSLKRLDYGYQMVVQLPSGLTISKFRTCSEGLEQNTHSQIRFKHLGGRKCQIDFGMVRLREYMKYVPSLSVPDKPLAIPLYTSFGVQYLDFSQEASTHALIGGATRMGKSAFFRLIIALLLLQTSGNVQIFAIDNKIADLWVFKNIPNVTTAETLGEAETVAQTVLDIIYARKNELKRVGDSVDASEYRMKHADVDMSPVFFMIDEFGRFAGEDGKDFQAMVTEIAETAGYVDVHLIISAQRPDAKEVLRPRIKNNLLTRVAFTAADEGQSELILGIPDAKFLGAIQGRAILLDGLYSTIQVPFMTTDEVTERLNKMFGGDVNVGGIKEYPDDEQQSETSGPRSADIGSIDEIPRFIPRSDWSIDLSDGGESGSDGKPHYETDGT